MSSAQEKEAAKEDDYGTKFLEHLAWVAVGAAAVVVAFFIGNFARQGFSTDPAEWGQFGDYVGGLLNPTFSLIALLVLIKTMHLQVKELNQAHQEMKNSADALKAQQETMELQRFETTFFNLCEQIKKQSIHFKNNIWPTLSEDIKENFNFESKINDLNNVDQLYTLLELTYNKERFKGSPNPFKFLMGKDKENYLSNTSLLIEILFFTLDTIDNKTDENNGSTGYRSILKTFVSPELICFLFTIHIRQKHSGEITTIDVSPYIEKYHLLSWLKHHDWEKYIVLVDKSALADRYASEPKVFIDKVKALGKKSIIDLKERESSAELRYNDLLESKKKYEIEKDFYKDIINGCEETIRAQSRSYEEIKSYVAEYEKENAGLYDMDVGDNYHDWLDSVKKAHDRLSETHRKIENCLSKNQ